MSRCRRRARSTPAPLENDDLLLEILLRLAPLPSSLPRASAVSKRWRDLVSDPRFLIRFRVHHSHNPPLLGFFASSFLEPTMDPPNRIRRPDGDLYRCLDEDDIDDYFENFGCRHGLALLFDPLQKQLLVQDPINGDKHHIAVPPGLTQEEYTIGGTVLRPAVDSQHFQVVLVTTDTEGNTPAFACVYSSETGRWGNLISLLLPTKNGVPSMVCTGFPAILVGHSLYWLLSDQFEKERSNGILQFDLERQVLAVIPIPVQVVVDACPNKLQVMRANGGGLGLFFLSRFSAQMWKMETDTDGVASWVLGRTVELDKVLLMSTRKESETLAVRGFAECNSVVFLRSYTELFMIQLEPLQVKKVPETGYACYHPFESVYAAGTGIGGRHDGVELLHNT